MAAPDQLPKITIPLVTREPSIHGPRTMASAFIEAFNSRLRQECLNASWFLSMADARDRINAWKIDYNDERPHSALGNLTPSAFAAQLKPARKVA